jgi:hypothetical protein
MPPEDRDPLEDLLDAAGRAVQPAHPGWQQLTERLARRPQQRQHRSRWWWLPAGTGVAAAALLVVGILFPPIGVTPIPAREIEVQRLDVELTVLSGAETHGQTLYMPLRGQMAADAGAGQQTTGQALVKDHRLVLNLRRGDNVVRFTDVAVSIDPTSVRFVSTNDPDGTQVVEQNFEYDLATADSLLKRYLEREVTCIGKDGREVSGYLVSFDAGNLVLASGPPPAPGKTRSTQSLARATLQAVRLNEVPGDLLVKPTLVWKLRTQKPGRHDTVLTYLCGLVEWHADYVAVVTPGNDGAPDLLDLTGWVSLDNRSGATYEKAGLKLIAGDVHRQRDEWDERREREFQDRLNRTLELAAAPVDAIRKALAEHPFFEYHLYTLTAPSTVRDRETKQLNLLHGTGVKASRRYVFDPATTGRHLAVELVVKNDKENQLGMPLPKGRVTFEQRDQDGESAFLGRVLIDHTAVNEELTLRHGSAFDVTGAFRETARDRGEMRVRNHKEHAVQVRAVAHLPLGRQLLQASLPATPHDATTVFFDFALPPNAEQVITYTISPPDQELSR